MSNKMVLSIVLEADQKNAVSGLKATSTELKHLDKDAVAASKGTETLSKKTEGTTKAISSLKGIMATIGFGAMATDMFKSISSTQKLQAQLKTITGDFLSAGVELDRLIGFAKKTPFTIDQSVDAFAKLTHLGLNPSEAAMMSYGNTASAMGKDMMQMVEAVADASVFEFERLKEFGIKASQQKDKVSFTFQGVTTTVKKNSTEIQKYLLDIGNTKFAGAMTDQMTTLGAKVSNLGISVDVFYKKLGETGLTDNAGNAIDYLADSVNLLGNNLPAVIGHVETFAMFFAAGAAITYAPILFTTMKAKALQYSVAAKTAAASTSLIAKSQGALMALYAGWEIGSYIYDEFVEARVAGLAFVGAMDKGFKNLSYAFKVATAAVDFAWDSTINFIYDKFADLLEFIADGADMIGMDEYADQFKKWEQEVRTGINTGSDFEATMKTLNAERDVAIDKIDSNIIALINHEYAQEENKTKTKTVTTAVKENTAAVEKSTEKVAFNKEALSQLQDELNPMRVLTRNLTANQTLLNTALAAGEISASDYEVATADLNKKFDEQVNKTSKAKESVNAYAKSWEQAVERVDEAIADGWLDLLEGKSTNIFESILGGFKRMLAEMLHLAITKPIMLNIQQGVSGVIPGLGGSAAAGGGGLGLGNILNLASGGIGGGISGLGMGLVGAGSTLGLGSLGVLGTGMAATGGAISSMGLVGGLGASIGNAGALMSGGSLMAGIGAALPVIGIVAGAAKLVDSLTGGGLFGTSYKTTDHGVNLEYAGGGFEGENYEKKKKKKSFFRGSKRKTVTSDLDASIVAGMNSYFDGVESLVMNAAHAMDITEVSKTITSYTHQFGGEIDESSETITQSLASYMNSFSAAASLSLENLNEEEAAAAIQNWTQSTADKMISGVFGEMLDDMAVQGENLTQTLTRVIQQLSITTTAFDSINLSLTNLSTIAGVSAVQYADDVAKAAGGTDRLSALVQGYQAAFFTQEELLTTQLTAAAAQMNSALDFIGADSTNFRSQFEAASSQGLAANDIVNWLETGNMIAQVEAITEKLMSTAGESASALIEQALTNGAAIANESENENVAAEDNPVVEAIEATADSTQAQTEVLTTTMSQQTAVIQDLNNTSKEQHNEQISVLANIASLLERQLESAKSLASNSAAEISQLATLMEDMVTEQRNAADKLQTSPVIVQGEQL